MIESVSYAIMDVDMDLDMPQAGSSDIQNTLAVTDEEWGTIESIITYLGKTWRDINVELRYTQGNNPQVDACFSILCQALRYRKWSTNITSEDLAAIAMCVGCHYRYWGDIPGKLQEAKNTLNLNDWHIYATVQIVSQQNQNRLLSAPASLPPGMQDFNNGK